MNAVQFVLALAILIGCLIANEKRIQKAGGTGSNRVRRTSVNGVEVGRHNHNNRNALQEALLPSVNTPCSFLAEFGKVASREPVSLLTLMPFVIAVLFHRCEKIHSGRNNQTLKTSPRKRLRIIHRLTPEIHSKQANVVVHSSSSRHRLPHRHAII